MTLEEKRSQFFQGFRYGHKLAISYSNYTPEDAIKDLQESNPNASPAYIGGFDAGFVDGQEDPSKLAVYGLPETLFTIWLIEESDRL